jgi:hypothetical protein
MVSAITHIETRTKFGKPGLLHSRGLQMALAQKTWTPIPVHRVILAWLRAERRTYVAARLAAFPQAVWMPGVAKLLDQADLESADENRARLRLLYLIRNIFFTEIPLDTQWYEVEYLTDSELSNEVHAVSHADWNDPRDRNELPKLAARKQIELRAPPDTWDTPIVWGHNRDGPFTVLEGNKRLTAYVSSGQKGIKIPVFVGLSAIHCMWHIFDQYDTVLAADL